MTGPVSGSDERSICLLPLVPADCRPIVVQARVGTRLRGGHDHVCRLVRVTTPDVVTPKCRWHSSFIRLYPWRNVPSPGITTYGARHPREGVPVLKDQAG